MKEYIAIKHGYDNVKVREPGERFRFAGAPADWMKPVDGKSEPAHKEPQKASAAKAAKAEKADKPAKAGKADAKVEPSADSQSVQEQSKASASSGDQDVI